MPDQDTTTPEFVIRAQAGDQRAFSALYTQFSRPLYAYLILRTKHRETAEDLVSQTWVKAWRAIKRCHPDQFKPWLYTIARHSLIDQYRQRIPEVSWDQLPHLRASTDPAHETDVRRTYEQIRDQLADLTPEQREVIILRLWDDLTFDEIAVIMKKSSVSCRMLMTRAVKTLRAQSPVMLIIISLYAQHYR